jgi:hypothetical protein
MTTAPLIAANFTLAATVVAVLVFVMRSATTLRANA